MTDSFTDRYTVAAKLGEGGMAEVFRVRDGTLERDIAMKSMNQQTATSKHAQRRFHAEAKIMGQLSHPGVVPLYDTGVDDQGRDCYFMKEVRGRTLRAILDEQVEHDRPDYDHIARMVDIFVRVCETVAYVHAEGIVHRDIKPGNIMVDDFGAVYLLDWGIAKQGYDDDPPEDETTEPGLDRTAAGTVLGTPGYMAPEQAFGLTAQATARADVFALGCVLYEILTGERAFQRRTADESAVSQLSREPEPARVVNTAVPGALSVICKKALSPLPDDRYANASELVDDLRAYRAFRPIGAVRSGPLKRLGLWAHRKPQSFGVAMGVLVSALVFAGVLAGTAMERRPKVLHIRAIGAQLELQLQQLGEALKTSANPKSVLRELVVVREAYLRDLIAESAIGRDPFNEAFATQYKRQTWQLLEELERLGRTLEVRTWANILLRNAENGAVFTADELAKLRTMTRSQSDKTTAQ